MTKLNKNTIFLLIGCVIMAVYFIGLGTVFSADLTSITDVMSGLKISTSSNHTIQFTAPNGVGAAETITITFPSDFDLGILDYTDMDIEDDTVDLTIAGNTPSGTEWGATTSSLSVIFTNGSVAIASTSVIKVELGTVAAGGATRITNPSTTGSKSITIATSFADNGTTTVQILTDDQVAVSASVTQSITFSISDTTIGFGSLNSGAARYATGDLAGAAASTTAHSLTAGTNGTSGYTMTVQGPTLTSGSDTITVIGGTGATSSTGSEQFGISIVATGGSGSVSSPYGTTDEFAYDAESAADQIASATGATADTVYYLVYLANIATDTEAGSYSTALTYIATANY